MRETSIALHHGLPRGKATCLISRKGRERGKLNSHNRKLAYSISDPPFVPSVNFVCFVGKKSPFPQRAINLSLSLRIRLHNATRSVSWGASLYSLCYCTGGGIVVSFGRFPIKRSRPMAFSINNLNLGRQGDDDRLTDWASRAFHGRFSCINLNPRCAAPFAAPRL